MANKFFSKKIIIPSFIILGSFLIAAGVFLFLNFKDNTPALDQAPQWSQETGRGVSIPACGSSSANATCRSGSPSTLLSWTTGGLAPDGTSCNTAIAIITKYPFPDSSSYQHIITPIGNAQISTSQSKFGGASAYFPNDSSYFQTPPSTGWDFRSGSFTLDFWIRFSGPLTAVPLYALPGWYVTYTGSQWGFMNYPSGASNHWIILLPATVTANNWYHIAFVRDGNTWYIFQNGIKLGQVTNSESLVYSDTDTTLLIGYTSPGVFMDEVRISKGIARWTSNFTPPSAPYVSDASTNLLFHADLPQDGAIINGLDCNGSYTWNGGLSNETYAYDLRFEGNGGYNGHLISNGTFTTPNCAPPLPGNFNLSLGSPLSCNSVPLTWTASTNAAAYRILKGSSRIDISPYQPYTALNFADTSVSQNTTYRYQIEAYNSTGTNRSNAINVTTPYCPPSLNFSGNPTTIDEGRSSILTWSSSYTNSCTASGAWSGSKALNGSETVFPAPPPSATYNLQCSGLGGTTPLQSVIINIVKLPIWREIIPR